MARRGRKRKVSTGKRIARALFTGKKAKKTWRTIGKKTGRFAKKQLNHPATRALIRDVGAAAALGQPELIGARLLAEVPAIAGRSANNIGKLITV